MPRYPMKSNPYSVRITALKRHRSLQLLTPLNQLHIRYSCVHSETPLSCRRYHHCNLVYFNGRHHTFYTLWPSRVRNWWCEVEERPPGFRNDLQCRYRSRAGPACGNGYVPFSWRTHGISSRVLHKTGFLCSCHNNRLFRPDMELKSVSNIESVVS